METKTKRITLLLTVIYGALVVWIILFKMAALSEIANLDHIRGINLIPFHYDEERSYHMSEVQNNVLIFIPFGVYLAILKIKGGKAVLWGTAFSLVLEMLQFVLAIGATDITDLITNTLGTAMGVGIYWVLAQLFRNRDKLNRVLNGLAVVCTAFLVALAALLLLAN